MNKKKIFVASSVLLVLFSVITLGLVAFGKGNPWEEIWEAIADLTNRVNRLEEEQDYVRHLRFYEPDEHTAGHREELLVKTFTVTPSNPSNNAILDFYLYCETKVDPGEAATWSLIAVIIKDENGDFSTSIGWLRYGPFYQADPPSYFWTRVVFPEHKMDDYPTPNQSSYTFEVYLQGDSGTAYMQNLNLVIELMDGLPPTS